MINKVNNCINFQKEVIKVNTQFCVAYKMIFTIISKSDFQKRCQPQQHQNWRTKYDRGQHATGVEDCFVNKLSVKVFKQPSNNSHLHSLLI